MHVNMPGSTLNCMLISASLFLISSLFYLVLWPLGWRQLFRAQSASHLWVSSLVCYWLLFLSSFGSSINESRFLSNVPSPRSPR